MTTLLISPDYLSHYNPLSVLGRAVAARGDRVVVATGPTLRERVQGDGFEWVSLALGPASNGGLTSDDPALRHFLLATERGPAATIRYQATERERDLLWQPERVAVEVHDLVGRLAPDRVIVDHVSFGSTLALYATGHEFITLVPGHPTQLPVGSERYGLPPLWPAGMQPGAGERAELELVADRVAAAFTDRWNRALTTVGADRPPVDDAYRVHGRRVLYNTVAGLQAPARRPLLPPDHRFVGPLVRPAPSPGAERSWHQPTAGRPQVYVALGTFLANRGDVLARLAAGLRKISVRAAIATGPTPVERLGPVPDDWIVAPTLPQVALLADADVAIHHGGNNSVQEALAAGCRQIVLPFSTDQFASAADLQQRADAVVVPPNEATADDIASAVETALGGAAPAAIPTLPPGRLAAALDD